MPLVNRSLTIHSSLLTLAVASIWSCAGIFGLIVSPPLVPRSVEENASKFEAAAVAVQQMLDTSGNKIPYPLADVAYLRDLAKGLEEEIVQVKSAKDRLGVLIALYDYLDDWHSIERFMTNLKAMPNITVDKKFVEHIDELIERYARSENRFESSARIAGEYLRAATYVLKNNIFASRDIALFSSIGFVVIYVWLCSRMRAGHIRSSKEKVGEKYE